MITKTYEFAYLIPRDAHYITHTSVVRENKDPGRKEQRRVERERGIREERGYDGREER